MIYRRMMIFPVFAFLLTMTACTGLRPVEGRPPEETMTAGTGFRSSKLSPNELWNLNDKLEAENAACQKRVADQMEANARLNTRISDQHSEMTRATEKIISLNHAIDEMSTKMKQMQEAGKPGSAHAAPTSWGTIMHVKGKTNIRTKRSADSRIRGSLMPGQTVRADLLKDNWYAVFKTEETERSEINAMGYVYAPILLKSPSPETAAGAGAKGKEIFTVAVKSILHKVLPGGKEALLVEFDRFYVPAVYNIEGDAPMIIMDVTRTSSMKKEWSDMRTDGTLIKKIRVNLNPAADILRIVLDMTPDKDYDIKPTFYTGRGNEVYALEVTGVTLK